MGFGFIGFDQDWLIGRRSRLVGVQAADWYGSRRMQGVKASLYIVATGTDLEVHHQDDYVVLYIMHRY